MGWNKFVLCMMLAGAVTYLFDVLVQHRNKTRR
jgi:hypothetical protein